jgi:peptidyl-prolyl cis-trans isomerase C
MVRWSGHISAAVVAGAVVALLAGCRRRSPAEGTGEVVARVDDAVITRADLDGELKRQGHALGRAPSIEKQREVLGEMIRTELLVQEARRRKLDRSADLLRWWRQQLVARLLREESEGKTGGDEITDGDLEQYFAAHQEDFSKPEEVRVSEILVRDEGKARRAIKELSLPPGAPAADPAERLRHVVEKYSEDAAGRTRAGDLGFIARKSAPYPAAIVDAAFGLGPVGSVSAPIAVEGTYRVLVLTGRRPAVRHSLSEVKGQVRQKLVAERQKLAVGQLVERLQRSANTEVLLPAAR